ncbi:MAG: DUF4339 domain-containing protein [Mariniblastus sp.]|nr:DUF4339 domain-containing protein [Mariniblastus sp.]
MPAMQFFVMDELTGQQSGPYSLQQIQEQIRNRKLKKKDFVRRADSAQWGKASVILAQVFERVEQQKQEKKRDANKTKSKIKETGRAAEATAEKHFQIQEKHPATEESSEEPFLGTIDSWIQIKQSAQPRQVNLARADQLYERMIYVYITIALLAAGFGLFIGFVKEDLSQVLTAVVTPISIVWFLVGIWVLRKTSKLVRSTEVMISTSLPAGLTNLFYRLLGALLVCAGALLLMSLSVVYLMNWTSGRDADTPAFILQIWLLTTAVLPLVLGAVAIGYIFWNPGITLTSLTANGVTRTDETVAIFNEFLAAVIIQMKCLYEKLPKLLFVAMLMAVAMTFSMISTPLLEKFLVDGATWELVLKDDIAQLVTGVVILASSVPFLLWIYSLAGILFVELCLAVLACGRLAIRKLQS